MAGNNQIQILRGTSEGLENHKSENLLDGQPLYDKTNNWLSIGDGSTIENRQSISMDFNLDAMSENDVKSLWGNELESGNVLQGIQLGEAVGTAYEGSKGAQNASNITALQNTYGAINGKVTELNSSINDLKLKVDNLESNNNNGGTLDGIQISDPSDPATMVRDAVARYGDGNCGEDQPIGNLITNSPINPYHAATKEYVDSQMGGGYLPARVIMEDNYGDQLIINTMVKSDTLLGEIPYHIRNAQGLICTYVEGDSQSIVSITATDTGDQFNVTKIGSPQPTLFLVINTEIKLTNSDSN